MRKARDFRRRRRCNTTASGRCACACALGNCACALGAGCLLGEFSNGWRRVGAEDLLTVATGGRPGTWTAHQALQGPWRLKVGPAAVRGWEQAGRRMACAYYPPRGRGRPPWELRRLHSFASPTSQPDLWP